MFGVYDYVVGGQDHVVSLWRGIASRSEIATLGCWVILGIVCELIIFWTERSSCRRLPAVLGQYDPQGNNNLLPEPPCMPFVIQKKKCSPN